MLICTMGAALVAMVDKDGHKVDIVTVVDSYSLYGTCFTRYNDIVKDGRSVVESRYTRWSTITERDY